MPAEYLGSEIVLFIFYYSPNIFKNIICFNNESTIIVDDSWLTVKPSDIFLNISLLKQYFKRTCTTRCSSIIRIHDNMNTMAENSRPKSQTTNTLPAVFVTWCYQCRNIRWLYLT